MAISIRLNTHRRTAVATATGLPRHARNDKMGTHETVPDRSACRSSPATIQPFPSVIPLRHSGPGPDSSPQATNRVPAIPDLLGSIRRRIRRAADNLNAPPHRQQAVGPTAAMLKCTNRPV